MSRIMKLRLQKATAKSTSVQIGKFYSKNEGQKQTGSSTNEISQTICGFFKGRQFK
jgi:hypothetical protein